MAHLWRLGYAPEDIITNIFRVAKHLEINESLKLKFVQVKYSIFYIFRKNILLGQSLNLI